MKVLLIEDDREVSEMVKISLSAGDNTVEIAEDGANGSFLARSFDYDAIILDNALPKKNGLTVCKEVRAAGKNTPILFLSVTSDVATKVSAFEKGADDYMVKPFSLDELNARIKAVARRPTKFVKPKVLKLLDLEVDIEKHIITRGGVRIFPTHKEFNLLEFFLNNTGIVLSRALIMEHVWSTETNPFSNTVEAHIRNLRLKVNAGNKPNLIGNVTGRGYIMDTPENLQNLKQ